MIALLEIRVPGKGLHEITAEVARQVSQSELREGLCTLFLRHTSASLLIQENADASVRHDLERWLDRLVPEGDSLYTHTQEGPDDMPGHLKAALTATQLSIPFQRGALLLGTWQGIYLWEHRRQRGNRQIAMHLAP
jgi:secondary thiamine-phosphate synthase enzyme